MEFRRVLFRSVCFEYFESGGLRPPPDSKDAKPRRRLEAELECKLNLARIVDGARCAVERAGRAFQVVCWRGWTSGGFRVERAEARGTINGVEVANVQRVGKVEG